MTTRVMVRTIDIHEERRRLDDCRQPYCWGGEKKPHLDSEGMSKPPFSVIICDLSCKISNVAMAYSHLES